MSRSMNWAKCQQDKKMARPTGHGRALGPKDKVLATVKRVEWVAASPGPDGLYSAMLECFVAGERVTIATKIFEGEVFDAPIEVVLGRELKPKRFGEGFYRGGYREMTGRSFR